MEQMDPSTLTDDKSDVTKIINSLVEGHMTMFELNKKLEEFDMDRLKMETMEIVESKTSSESQTNIEYSTIMAQMQLDIVSKLDEQESLKTTIKDLEDTLQMKEIEIKGLKEKKLTDSETIERLNHSKADLDFQVEQMKKAYEQIRDKYEKACKEQIHAQREFKHLEAEKMILEKSYQAEKDLLFEKLTFNRTVQSNFIKKNTDEYEKKIQALDSMHNTQQIKMKKDMEWSFEQQIRKYKKDIETVENERDHLKNRVKEQEIEFQALTTGQDKLKTEIFKYERLLNIKLVTNSAVEKEKQQINFVKREQSAKSEERSKTEINKAPDSRNDSDKRPESDLKPNPLSIKEVDPTGQFLVIRSSDKDEIDISYWTIESTLPGGDKAPFSIPDKTKISLGKDLKIWSTPGPDKKGPRDIVLTCSTWGTGKGVIKVKNINGKEKILHPID